MVSYYSMTFGPDVFWVFLILRCLCSSLSLLFLRMAFVFLVLWLCVVGSFLTINNNNYNLATNINPIWLETLLSLALAANRLDKYKGESLEGFLLAASLYYLQLLDQVLYAALLPSLLDPPLHHLGGAFDCCL